MMLAQLTSAALRGIDSYLVRVEVNIGEGLPTFAVVGLAEGAVREGKERVWAALRNSGYTIPSRKVTVNLAPADVRKDGSAFDLPLALGLLAGAGRIPIHVLTGAAFVGEMGLDGTLRPVRGALSMAEECRRRGVRTLFLPQENAPEGAVVRDLDVLGAQSLSEVVLHLKREQLIPPAAVSPDTLLEGPVPAGPDLSDVRGQAHVKRALEVAAAGGHNILLLGAPGSGKTMLARRLPGILPPLSLDEAVEVTRVHSAGGLLPPGEPLLRARPFRAPHHTISDGGLVGGGGIPRPGEVSLAHNGVLFLDELPEFRRNVLEALRQPLEDGFVVLSRARASFRFPCRFVLAASMNPCPCGFYGDGTHRCTCDPNVVARYRSRVSGPLLDRIDLHVPMQRVPFRDLAFPESTDESVKVRERVCRARDRQRRRFREERGTHCNGQMSPGDLRKHCRASREVARLLQAALERLRLSARAYHRILKVARTVADLAGSDQIGPSHVAEAIQYRGLDRSLPL